MRSCSCPNCSANLTIDDENRDFCFCQYCGAKIMLDDYRSSHRIVDEARIRETENDKIIRLKELELEEAQTKQNIKLRSILLKIWIPLTVIILIIGLGIMFFSGEDGPLNGFLFMFYVAAPIIVGGAILIFKVIPDKTNDKILLRNGGIRFPKSLEPFSEQNYIAAQQILRNMGFQNITCINMHDVKLGIFQKTDEIESITINGEKILSGGKVYPCDAHIIIKYHGR